MIFRDKKTGALLNIRRVDYINDRLYFSEIMRVVAGAGAGAGAGASPQRFTRPFEELQSDDNNT
jgi:hypothetical protein